MTTQQIILDWTEFSEEAESQFKQALKRFGVYLYSDPYYEGTDTFGIVLSDSKLTPEQVRSLTESQLES